MKKTYEFIEFLIFFFGGILTTIYLNNIAGIIMIVCSILFLALTDKLKNEKIYWKELLIQLIITITPIFLVFGVIFDFFKNMKPDNISSFFFIYIQISITLFAVTLVGSIFDRSNSKPKDKLLEKTIRNLLLTSIFFLITSILFFISQFCANLVIGMTASTTTDVFSSIFMLSFFLGCFIFGENISFLLIILIKFFLGKYESKEK